MTTCFRTIIISSRVVGRVAVPKEPVQDFISAAKNTANGMLYTHGFIAFPPANSRSGVGPFDFLRDCMDAWNSSFFENDPLLCDCRQLVLCNMDMSTSAECIWSVNLRCNCLASGCWWNFLGGCNLSAIAVRQSATESIWLSGLLNRSDSSWSWS
jgi:hypothetical protein